MKKEQSLQQHLPTLEQIESHQARRYFDWFVRSFWGVIVEDELVWNWHISYLCEELQKVAMRVFARMPKEYDLVINIPPGTTKSTIATIMFPAWCWIHDNDMQHSPYPHPTASLKFITGSYSNDLSLEHADLSREIIRSEKYQRYFPEVKLRVDKDAKSNYENTHRGQRFSTSTGARALGKHGLIIIIDDPINPKQAMAETKKELNAANNWIDRTLSTRKVDKAVTPTITIMQRLAEMDPTGHILEKAKAGTKVKHICLPGEVSEEVRPIEMKDNYIDGLLDPVRLSKGVLTNMRVELGPVAYAGQVEQKPAPEEGIMFDIGKFNIVENFSARIVNMVRYWDKAGTQGGGAYTSGVLVAELANGNTGIANVVRGQWNYATREPIIKNIAVMDGINVIGYVEQEPGSGGKESAERTMNNLKGYKYYADRVTGSKEARAEPYSAVVQNGTMEVLKRDWTQEFIEEHQVFPAGRYRDQVDAAAGGFNKLYGAKKKVGIW